jgi:hypothetical protein
MTPQLSVGLTEFDSSLWYNLGESRGPFILRQAQDERFIRDLRCWLQIISGRTVQSRPPLSASDHYAEMGRAALLGSAIQEVKFSSKHGFLVLTQTRFTDLHRKSLIFIRNENLFLTPVHPEPVEG